MKKIAVNGGTKLKGTIKISGAKNSTLPIMVASLLCKGEVVLYNAPRVGDVEVMMNLIRTIGGEADFKDGTVRICSNELNPNLLSHSSIIGKIRYSTHFLGALLQRYQKVRIPMPGGCRIGTRKLDSHILGLTRLGAEINVQRDFIEASVKDLQGSHMRLEYPSVGATENNMIASCLASGNTVIENPAREPEIIDLASFLNSMGAEISGAGTDTIRIRGVEELHPTEYSVIPDRIETGTYIVAAAATRSEITIEQTDIELLESVISCLSAMGIEVEESDGSVQVFPPEKIIPTEIETKVYPGFPTDMQPILTTLLSIADGESKIVERIFDNRFKHVKGLTKMGAHIDIMDNTLLISGVDELKGSKVEAFDLRCGGSLIVAGLVAKGKTVIEQADQILRGYESPVEKLTNVGADLTYLDDS